MVGVEKGGTQDYYLKKRDGGEESNLLCCYAKLIMACKIETSA